MALVFTKNLIPPEEEEYIFGEKLSDLNDGMLDHYELKRLHDRIRELENKVNDLQILNFRLKSENKKLKDENNKLQETNDYRDDYYFNKGIDFMKDKMDEDMNDEHSPVSST